MARELGGLTRLVLAAGGTGGHVFPALAVAGELRRRRPEAAVSFVGRPDSLEQRLVEGAGFEMDALLVGRLAGQDRRRQARTLAGLPGAVLRAGFVLRRRRPELVLGTGGFVSGPTVLAAALAGVPTVVHEQNAVAGLTTRLLRGLADAVALGQSPPGRLPRRAAVTGNPVRPEFLAVPEYRPGRPFRVLVLGGSQGARRLNEATLHAAERLADLAGGIEIVLQCGERWSQALAQAAAGLPVRVEVQPFLHDVPARLAAASFVVCRAGASTVAELCAAGRPALLVPFPQAAADHQTANARTLVAAGAADTLADADLDGEELVQRIRRAARQPERLAAMAAAARKLAPAGAAAAIVDLAEAVLASRTGRPETVAATGWTSRSRRPA